jgi:PAS domain S-box-containing protein
MNHPHPDADGTGAAASEERERLAAVRATGLLDDPHDADLAGFPQLAARACAMPMAAISLLDADRQVLVGRIGIEVRETSREHAFCARVVARNKPLEVHDALREPTLRDNPLVTGAPGIRSYAAVPLAGADGHCIGTLFVADHVPRTIDDGARALLAGLAREAARAIEQRTEAARMRRMRRVQEAATAALGRVVDAEALNLAFEGMLADLLAIADSEYGFIGEVRHTREGAPYLKTHAITNIAWNEETRALYERQASSGMEFRRLDTLFGHAMTSQAEVYANDAPNDPRRGGLPPGHPPLNAFVGLPVHSRGRMLGMIGLANRPDGYAPWLGRELEPLLAAIASIIESARAERERRVATEELARQRAATLENERRFRAALESLDHVAVQAYGADGRITFWNRASEVIYGIPARTALGNDVVELLFPPAERAGERELMARMVASGEVPAASEVALARADGGQATVFAARVLVPRADGAPEFFCFDVDMTERRRAEAAVREGAQMLRDVADTVHGAIQRYVVRADGSEAIEYASAGCREIWELEPEQVVGNPERLWSMVVAEDRAGMRASVADSARTLRPWRHQWRIRTPSGRLKVLAGHGVPRRAADGGIVWITHFTDVSERHAAEQALATSEARYRAIAENVPGAIYRYLLHPDGRHTVEFVSRGAQAIWEHAPAAIEADAQLLFAAIAPEDREGFRACLLESARTLGVWQYRWRITTPSGRRKWLQGSGQPVRRANGDIGWDGYVFDVTERREAEAALALSEARLRVLIDAAPEAIVVLDADARRLVDFNQSALDLYGLDADGLRNAAPESLRPARQPDGRESATVAAEMIGRALAGEAVTFEWAILRGDGREVPCEVHFVRLPDRERPLLRSSMVDLSARKAAEAALARSEARLRLVVQNMADGFFLLDRDWRFVEVNPAAARYLARPAESLLGHDLREVMPGAMQAAFGPAATAVMASGTTCTIEDHYSATDSWFETRITPVGGGVAAFFTDITERRQAEQALRESEQRFRSLVEDIGTIAVQGYDRERRIVFWNRGSEQMYGWSAAEALGRRLEDTIIPEPMREAVVDLHTRWIGQGHIDVPSEELVLVDRHGLPVPVYSSHIMQRQVDGESVMYCLDVDLRDLRRTEDALQQANAALRQRNAELQQFVMIASHDLQEPLRKVQTFADRLQAALADRMDTQEADYVLRLTAAATRMRALIQDLLDYSAVSFGNPQHVPVDLDAVLGEVLDDLEPSVAASGARVRRGPLGRVAGDPMQMRQLLQNLVGNALKYRAPGRPTEIEIDGEDIAGDGRPMLRIRIADNGIGFDAAHRERIFAPFQRLHARNEYSGTGIGLAIVRRIVDQHGGRIEADGRPGLGATFRVELPR